MQLDAAAVVVKTCPFVKAAASQVNDGGIEQVQQGFAVLSHFAVGALHQALRQCDEGRNALAGKRIGKCAAVNGAGV